MEPEKKTVTKSKVTETSISKKKSDDAGASKEVEDPSSVEWQTAKGSSSWNPGNTVEDRDFSDHAHEWMKKHLAGCEIADGISISKVTKAEGDLTVVSNRGKVKCIYDLSFKAEWEGSVEGEKVKGKIEITDIMAGRIATGTSRCIVACFGE